MLAQALIKSKNHKGHRIPHHQSNDVAPNRTEVVTIPSSSVPTFGSSFTIDFCREPNVLVVENILAFQLSAITVMTSGSFTPAQFLIDHIDYQAGGSIIESYYPEGQFLLHQLYNTDEDRFLTNCASGLYSSATQRQTMATNQTTYYLPLYDYFRSALGSFPILEPTHQHQMRVFLRPLPDVTIGTGAATASIVSCNLLQRVIRLREAEANDLRKDLSVYKHLAFQFPDFKRQVFTASSGLSSVSINLQSITGKVSALMFFVRPSASLTGAGAWAFTQIASYELLSSSGTNFVGGQVIANSMSLINGNRWSNSSYLAETALGLNNNNANVYIYSFAEDTEGALVEGRFSGNHNFTGSEVLKINFTSALAANNQIDIHAYCENSVTLTKSGVSKA